MYRPQVNPRINDAASKIKKNKTRKIPLELEIDSETNDEDRRGGSVGGAFTYGDELRKWKVARD